MEKSKHENRKKGKGVYYESHHIIPDFMFRNRKRRGPSGHLDGNPDDPKNLVLLTPREHILSHILLSKSLKGKRYWAQAASAVNWFFIKVIGNHPRQNKDLAGIMRKYDRYRKLGLNGISESRKGKFPAVDVETGKSVGSVSNTHPNVISGKWVHVTKGRIISDAERQKRCNIAKGKRNTNARSIDVDYIKTKMIEYDSIVKTIYDNNFIKIKFVEWFDSQQHDHIFYKFVNSTKIPLQKIGGLSGKFLNVSAIAEELRPVTNWNIPKYGMGSKYGAHNNSFVWYTNGVKSIQIRDINNIPDGFYKGRTC